VAVNPFIYRNTYPFPSPSMNVWSIN